MKRIQIPLILAALCSLGPMARAQSGPPTSNSQGEHTGTTLRPGTTIFAELKGSLDSKKLKPGDPVKLKTTGDASTNEHILLPKGTQLLGHVTLATVKDKGQNTSSLGIVFDKAILKNGEEVPLSAYIQAMAGAPASAPPPPAGVSAPPPGPPGSTSGMGGGGMRPNTTSSSNPSQYPSPTSNSSTQASPNSSAAASPSERGLDSQGELRPTSRGVFGIDGVALQPASEDSQQGSVILSKEKSVRLDGGTRLLLMTR